MPLQATSGAASYDAFGGGVVAEPNYIESCFSTWLYTGNGSTQTITNGIDLAGKGGLVWIKWRSGGGLGSSDNALYDTTRGVNNLLRSNTTAAQVNTGTGSNASVSAFNSNGFSLGADALYGRVNYLNGLFASWTFREQPKFFDVVTYTGDGTGNRTIPHSLGSTPGFITTKRTNTTSNWVSYHRAVTSPNANWWRNYGYLDLTDSFIDFGSDAGLSQAPDANNIYVGSYFNASGTTYVFYVYAHNAGGFGLSGTDNVISCGSFTGAATVTLGYEPQWVLYKRSDDASDWVLTDNMRGMYASFAGANGPVLEPNTSDAEAAGSRAPFVNATGFYFDGVNNGPGSAGTYIYIAIRRGPMRTPTTGTSVFAPIANVNSPGTQRTTGFVVDLQIGKTTATPEGSQVYDRLRGIARTSGVSAPRLDTSDVAAEFATTNTTLYEAWNTGYKDGAFLNGESFVRWNFSRAPGFFDVVCYSGENANITVNHNLGVAPELIITKVRNFSRDWYVKPRSTLGLGNVGLILNLENASFPTTDASSTATTMTFNDGGNFNLGAGYTFVAYLFASCPGVSKVGIYTGNGSSQTINCGFTAGSRFVMIKRTNSEGDWLVADSARGIVAGSDPYLRLNRSSAQITGEDWLDTNSTGFVVNQVADTNANIGGATYIFLAIA